MSSPGTPSNQVSRLPIDAIQAGALYKSIGHKYPYRCPNPKCPEGNGRRVFTQEEVVVHPAQFAILAFVCVCRQDIVSCPEMVTRLSAVARPLPQPSLNSESYSLDEVNYEEFQELNNDHSALRDRCWSMFNDIDQHGVGITELQRSKDSTQVEIASLSSRIEDLTSITQDLQTSNKALTDLVHECHAQIKAMLKAKQDSDKLQDLLRQQNSKMQLQLNESVARLSTATSDITVLRKSLEQVKLHVQALPPSSASEPARPQDSASATYADKVRGILSPEQLSIIATMKPPPKPFRARLPKTLCPPDSTPTERLYFSGIVSCPLSILKQKLRSLRVRTSAIHNIAFVGRAICEFLVEKSYKDRLIALLTQCSFKYLPGYDPAVPQDKDVTQDVATRLREAYAKRLQTTVSTTASPFVRQIFLDMLSKIDTQQTPSDAPPTPMDVSPDASPVPDT